LDRNVQSLPDVMRSVYLSAIALFACLSITACAQTICQDGSSGNCGNGGTETGADASAEAPTCDDPNAVVCESECVDTAVNPTYCGSCDNSCAEGQGCAAGSCVDLCDPGLVNCGGVCIDPLTNGNFCGASGTCSTDTQGEDCAGNACSAGVCISQRYVGSLPPTSGRWNYGGTLGVVGAETQCRQAFGVPTAVVCTYPLLLDAQSKNELVNPVDSAGVAVTSWYILSPADNIQRQCTKINEANPIPWTYETQDLGEGSKYADVNTAGAVGVVVDNPNGATGCRGLRNVACCLP
jgi:hypothetical protein